jgi:hypothetical protein
MALGRWTARVLQLIGFAGLLVCLALAVSILVGRTWVSVAVGDAFTSADTSIETGLARIDDARARLAQGAGTLDELLTELGPLPATSPIPAAVAARVSQVVDTYAPARDRYVEARSEAQAALLYLQLARGAAPSVEIPPGVSDALSEADDRLARIDSALTGLRSAARATAGDVAAAATTLRDAVTTAAESAGTLRTAVDGLRVRIDDVHGSVDRVLWIGTAGLLAIVGYVALLNLLLVWLARRRPRTRIDDDGVTGVEASPGQ